MKHVNIQVADISMKISGDITEFFIERVTPYLINNTSQPMIDIRFLIKNEITIHKSKEIAQDNDRTWYYDADGNFSYFDYNADINKIIMNTTITKGESTIIAIEFYNLIADDEIKIINHSLKEYKQSEPNPKNRVEKDFSWNYPLLNSIDQAMRYAILLFDGLIIHSSAIAYNSNGLIFSAPSGVGKTTHTSLWKQKYTDTILVNDDTPILRFVDEKWLLYGSPWAGSSGNNTNIAVSMSAIIFLEQALVNSIEKLNPIIALSKLLNEMTKPAEECYMNVMFDLINKLLLHINCYTLKCTPTIAAVEMVETELKI